MKRLSVLTVALCGLSLGVSGAAQKDEFSKVIEGLGEHLGSNTELAPELRDKFAEIQNNERLEAGSITGLLRQMHPEFGDALRAAADDPADGIAALSKLAGSDDPFLAAESSYYLSRVLIGEERFEEALPHLKKIRDEYAQNSLRAGESLYYQGVCHANMLQRTSASDRLNDFVEQYPDASPRLVGSAWDLIASLERVHRGSIDDVATHMEFSRRKLGLTDAGDQTQQVQGHIITMLDDLIAMAEEQERQQQQQQQPPVTKRGHVKGSGQSPGQGSQMGNGSGQTQGGNASAQDAPRVVRRIRGAADSAWDDLRKRDRGTEALGALKSKYPARYRLLVDQYYRSLQSGDKPADE